MDYHIHHFRILTLCVPLEGTYSDHLLGDLFFLNVVLTIYIYVYFFYRNICEIKKKRYDFNINHMEAILDSVRNDTSSVKLR